MIMMISEKKYFQFQSKTKTIALGNGLINNGLNAILDKKFSENFVQFMVRIHAIATNFVELRIFINNLKCRFSRRHLRQYSFCLCLSGNSMQFLHNVGGYIAC